MKRVLLFITLGMLLLTHNAMAQKVALKTNLLYDATTTVNLGVEYLLSPKWTLDMSGNYNGWTFSDNKKIKHWLIQPEARYWLCESFNGHFLGAHLLGGEYNVGNVDIDLKYLGTDFRKLKDSRYDGWYAGAGIVYGYSWLLSKHWNLETIFGFGYVYNHYDTYGCANCGQKQTKDQSHNYWGPTKIALNLIYAF